MNRLWVFGDSFSAPYINAFEKGKDYIQWKGYRPKIWEIPIGLETIQSETNGKVMDLHFSERGQEDLADIILTKII